MQDDRTFIPDDSALKLYKEQITAFFESRNSKFETIDMGRLPKVFSVLGIADNQLKTNGKTILKALGIQGRNKHNVSLDTINNLLALVHDPEAVFKSLSVSNNPNAYIAVLNAKSEKNDQIIAVLSPSRGGNGFTFIPSVYEKDNFARFLGNVNKEQKVLYVKSKGSEIWGQLQSLPRHNPEPSATNILTKDDVVKLISSQTQNTPLERENTNSKEKNMENEWSAHDEYLAQRQIAVDAFQADLEGNNISLNHSFSETDAFFKIEKGIFDGKVGIGITVYDDKEAMLKAAHPYPEYVLSGNDINVAKDMVEKLIKRFDNKPDVYIGDIETRLKYAVAMENLIMFEKRSEQAQNTPLERENINSKEKNMENEWSAHDEYLAQRQIAVDAFQADLEGNYISLNHSFSEADAFFKIEKGIFDGKPGVGIFVFDDEKAMRDHKFYSQYVLSGNDIELAKNMVESLIKRFDNKPEVYIDDIEKNLSFDIDMKNLAFKKQSEQAQNTPLERGNINSKEKSMPEEKERIDWENLDSKQKDFLNASIQRKAIADALKTGTLCCLPGADGYADTMPAKNMMSDHLYHGASLLLIKQHQKENGFPTGNYLTSEKIDEAKKDMPGLFLRKDQHSISLYSGMKNEATGEYETTRHKLFNIAQTTKPSELAAWVDQKQQEAHNSREEKKSVDFGASYAKQEYVSKNQPPRTDGPEIVCSSAKPEEYLGQYLAAVSLGGKFKASPEQAEEFSKNFEAGLYKKVTNEQGELMLSKKTGQPFTDPFSLQKIAEKANQHCVNLIRDRKIDAQKQNQPEQKLEQQQSRGRGI